MTSAHRLVLFVEMRNAESGTTDQESWFRFRQVSGCRVQGRFRFERGLGYFRDQGCVIRVHRLRIRVASFELRGSGVKVEGGSCKV